MGVTSLLLEQLLGGACVEHLDGWHVSLKGWACNVSLSWTESHVVLHLPITNRYAHGERRMSERVLMAEGALHGPTAWALAQLARSRLSDAAEHATIVDCCVGKGGVLIEAA